MLEINAVILFVSGIVCAWPFLRTPPDDHFANYTSWALFREPGSPLPAYFSCLNQGGLTRMFLYHLAALAVRLFGRSNLLFSLRFAALALNAVCGAGLYLVATASFDAHPVWAFAGALLYLLLSTRPQFELLKYNPEIYEVLGEILGIALICLWWPAEGESFWPLLVPFVWLVFVGLNCKALYCLNAAFIGLGAFIFSGFNPMMLAIPMLSVPIASLVFAAVMRNISFTHLASLKNYTGFFHKENIVENFKVNYKSFYYKTPMAGFFFLYVLCLPFSLQNPFGPIITLWSFASILTVIIQKRFVTYFFQIVFAPMSLVIASGLSAMADVHVVLPILAIAGFLYLARISLLEFPRYYKKMAPIDLVKMVYESFYWNTSYEFRIEDVLEHRKSHGGPFIPWQTNLLTHYLTDEPPIVLIGSMVYHAHVMYPQRQKMLLEAAVEKRPQWIYDFGGTHSGQFHFNPIGFYLSCGLAYVPRLRRQNIVYYELSHAHPCPLGDMRDSLQLYVVATAALDSFVDQLALHGVSAQSLPQWLNRDIAEIAADLVDGGLTVPSGGSRALEPALAGEPGVAGLYVAAEQLAFGLKDEALRTLEVWKANSAVLLDVYPALTLSLFALQKLAQCEESECSLPDKDFLAHTNLYDGARLLQLCKALLESGYLAERESGALVSMLQPVIREETVYRYYYTNGYNALWTALVQQYASKTDNF